MKKQQSREPRTSGKKKSAVKWAALIIIALILLAVYLYSKRNGTIGDASHWSEKTDTASLTDTLAVRDTLDRTDGHNSEKSKDKMIDDHLDTAPEHLPVTQQKDLGSDTTTIHSLSDAADYTQSTFIDSEPIPDPCSDDTLELRAYPSPAGGFHYGSIEVEFIANRECSIQWRVAGDEQWLSYGDQPIRIKSSTTIIYRAFDICGASMPPRREFYEIRPESYLDKCPDDMIYVTQGDLQFCIDRYPWPNRKGLRPVTFVSLYEAMDSCFSVDKRLPRKKEWSLACSGPSGWNYPYGKDYDSYACATHRTEKPFAGDNVGCRSYFGAYDMSGGVAEWTSTVSDHNKNFFNVMGGFWESGNQSSCFDARYSYFPQNRHNPVGFRCVKDINDPATTGDKRE